MKISDKESFISSIQKTLFLFGLGLMFLSYSAQAWAGKKPDVDTTFYKVDKINISGNRITQSFVILRECTFKVGDTLSSGLINAALQDSKQNLINTFLFHSVDVSWQKLSEHSITMTVEVVERFYTLPLPGLSIADRNFNVWWVEHNHDLKRLNAGVSLLQRNLRGRNETLTLIFQLGYTRQFGLQYIMPFINKRMRSGLQVSAIYSQNKEVYYNSVGNKQAFYSVFDKGFLRRRMLLSALYTYRPAIYNKNSLELDYCNNQVDSVIAQLSPDYFLNHQVMQRYFYLKYQWDCDHRDVKAYPLSGYLLSATMARSGLLPSDNVKMTEATLLCSKYTPVGGKYYLYNSAKVKLSAPFRQPYYNQRGLGYQTDFVRGYEYYVVDGQQFFIARNELKYWLIDYAVPMRNNKFWRGQNLPNIPIKMYLKVFYDLGYVNDDYYFNHNKLNNTWLYSYGAGLDIATWYDIVGRIELSRNRQKETGVYLHLKANI